MFREKRIRLKKVIEMIKNAGGLAILAHPVYITEDYDKIVFAFETIKGIRT